MLDQLRGGSVQRLPSPGRSMPWRLNEVSWWRLRCMALLAEFTPASQEPGSRLILNSVQACRIKCPHPHELTDLHQRRRHRRQLGARAESTGGVFSRHEPLLSALHLIPPDSICPPLTRNQKPLKMIEPLLKISVPCSMRCSRPFISGLKPIN
jgi:hypothetical protein